MAHGTHRGTGHGTGHGTGPRRGSARRGRLTWTARGGRALLAAAMLAVSGITAVGLLPHTPAPSARADEVTASQNDLRTGWDPQEPGLAPATLQGGTFGQLFATPVGGQVYAQPVVAGSNVIVATENDWVYGLNAATGAITWSRQLGMAWPAAAEGCKDLTPDVGVTGTPVYDPATGTVYLVSQEVPQGNSAYTPAFYMHALDAQTGAERQGWPVPIQGAPANDPGRPFNPFTELQRPALLLLGGSVYAAFGSHCDITPYVGYVVGVSTASRALTMWSDEAGVTDDMGGIWQSGGGLMSDGAGRIFLTSGNGVSPAPGPGSSPPPELAESVIRLGVQPDGSLQAQDFFSPANAPTLDNADTDFGSGGPAGLPFGTSADPGLLVQAGKDGRVFLLNSGNLGGREQGSGGADLAVSQSGPYGGQWGHPAAFGDTPSVTAGNVASASDYVYYVGANDYLRVLKLGLGSAGDPVLSDVANSTATFGYTSGSPVVTSNGTSPSSAVVWEVAASGQATQGSLEAFDAVPPAACAAASPCTMSPIWSAPIGKSSKFTIPATDGGRVYVGTGDGRVLGFGSPSTAPLTGASPVNFGKVGVGASRAVTVTVHATTSVTVTGVSASAASTPDPFSTAAATEIPAGASQAVPVTFPVTLAAGDSLRVPVRITPASPGGVTGFLAVATSSPNFPAVTVALTGDGTQAGLFAASAALSFGKTVDGTAVPKSVDIINGGTTTETVRAVTAPAGPFSAKGLPAVGTRIKAGQSLVVAVTFAPTRTGTDRSAFAIRGSGGTVQVGLTGIAVAGTSQLSPSARPVNFGSVPLGQQGTATLDITNTGNLPATITSASTLPAPFGAPEQVAAGLPVNPGYDLKIPLTFSPASTGSVATSYRIAWTDARGRHSLTVPVTGAGAAPAAGQAAVSPPGGGWTVNGSAQMSGRSLVLTPAAKNRAGSAVYPVPEPSDGLNVSFTARLGGGTGGNGLTFSMLNAARLSPAALGGTGGNLGFGGLSGIAVTLGTEKTAGNPSANFVGIATGAAGGRLRYAATVTRGLPRLRRGSHVVGVRVAGGKITVTVDGTRFLSKAVSLPSKVLLAFTGATGSETDVHSVTSATISANGSAVPPPGGGWSYNGAAGMAASDSVLTTAARSKAGSVVYPAPLTVGGLQVQFDAQLGGGSGANGLTVALLNPASTSVTSVGGVGGDLGFGGLSGVGVALVTYRDPGYPSKNFAAISAGTGSNGLLAFQTSVRGIAPLRAGTHLVGISVTSSGGTDILIVTLDGEQVFQQAEPLLAQWGTARLAFTGGTGGLTDVHTVRDVAISVTG